MTAATMSAFANEYPTAQPSKAAFAGFWLRFAAFVIDWAIISTAVVGLFVVVAFASPRLANMVDVVGSGLPSTERTLWEGKATDRATNTRQAIVETTVLGRLTYVHKVTRFDERRDGVTTTRTSLTSKRVRLDPATRAEYTADWTLGSFYLLPWLLYMVIMEASKAQATIGKMALGIRVADVNGNRIGMLRALVRNLMKFVSAVLMFIGYFMAGWTQKKQALHDMAAGCIMPKAR